MHTIQARVNPRLLSKADRLFTGTLDGRIIELLQNARRAGATEVIITNQDGWVTVADNGRGIDDFAALLDLGGSRWEEGYERSEDPAGVGIFCLAPREVTIRSNGRIVTISGNGWTDAPVDVLDDPDPVRSGTVLRFRDERWDASEVTPRAVFSGLSVIVDGQPCPKLDFVSEAASHHAELGCRIEIREAEDLDQWHKACKHHRRFSENVLVNFHGQVVTLDDHSIEEHGLHYLVELTGEPTDIRLMLPARTRLVENEAYRQLRAALKLEAYRYIRRRGKHSLPYRQFLRAKELGIELPEAEPYFNVGLLDSGGHPQPVAVRMPEGFALSRCYRFDENSAGGETDEANAHLLAALGSLAEPFVPVEMFFGHDGYSWAELPTIGKVELRIGRELHSESLWYGRLTCVEDLHIAAYTSDGKVFASSVCMAEAPRSDEDGSGSADLHVLVTPQARERLRTSEMWYQLGGWSEEGDTYETQQRDFERELEDFWANMIGPEEQLRQSILAPLDRIGPDWNAVHVTRDGRIRIEHADGSVKLIEPLAASRPA